MSQCQKVERATPTPSLLLYVKLWFWKLWLNFIVHFYFISVCFHSSTSCLRKSQYTITMYLILKYFIWTITHSIVFFSFLILEFDLESIVFSTLMIRWSLNMKFSPFFYDIVPFIPFYERHWNLLVSFSSAFFPRMTGSINPSVPESKRHAHSLCYISKSPLPLL